MDAWWIVNAKLTKRLINLSQKKTNMKCICKRQTYDVEDVRRTTFTHKFYTWCLMAYWPYNTKWPKVKFWFSCLLLIKFSNILRTPFVCSGTCTCSWTHQTEKTNMWYIYLYIYNTNKSKHNWVLKNVFLKKLLFNIFVIKAYKVI